jgi:hypothetical protein
MKRKVAAARSPSDNSDGSDSDFKTPTNAARRLLEVIHRIEQIESESSDQASTESADDGFDSPSSSQRVQVHQSRRRVGAPGKDKAKAMFLLPRQKILEELRHIRDFVAVLDDEYEDLRFDWKLDL